MKAYVLHAVNDLRYDDIPMPECPSGWCIVKVKAAGICSSDIARVFTKGTYHFPTIPGHELAGEVVQVADESASAWVGKAVGIFPLIPCRSCTPCQSGHYEMCEHYDYVGSRRDGGFAEYVAVPIWNLIEMPTGTDFAAAAMLEPLAVALHALKPAGIKHGDRVAIIGTGMIGIAAAQWAKKLGAGLVCIIGRSDAKRALVESIPGMSYSSSQHAADIGEYDLVLEAVGTPQAIDLALNTARAGGKIVLMGNPTGDIPLSQKTYWRILRKQLTLLGTWNSSYESGEPCDWTEAAQAIADGSIDISGLISHRFAQDKLIEGLELIRDRKEPCCKVMTLWN